ncbi:MAG TPA: dehydrogenase, partial [Aequorivita sp.]|nr:dehydrogenase [Aequorivita sp.]
WGLRDPLLNYETYLLNEGVLSEEKIQQFRDEFKREIDENLDIAFAEPKIEFNETNELNDVYKPFNYEEVTANSAKEN